MTIAVKKPGTNDKLGKRQLPAGCSPDDFEYVGKPAIDENGYLNGSMPNPDIGLVDMVCVNQFGEANNAKGYHAGVVRDKKTGQYHAYFEWGRSRPGKSWEHGSWTGAYQDFQFTVGATLDQARSWFAGQVRDKNLARLECKSIGGIDLWCAKAGKDGYLIQDLATREKGLPDVLTVKDGSGVAMPAPTPVKTAAPAVVKSLKSWQPEVVQLARDLVGGTQTYTRSLSQASGVTPTMRAISKVRDQLIPAALQRLAAVGTNFRDNDALVAAQVKDSALRTISTTVNSLVPRPIPRTGWTDEQAILNSGNLLSLQADLDAFETALTTEDFTTTTPVQSIDPDSLLNAQLRWIDPNGTEGKWLWDAFVHMSNNRHGYMGSKSPKVRSLFAVERPDRDARFLAEVQRVGARVQGKFSLRGNLQPRRTDLAGLSDEYAQANVILSIHGTRPVNIAPIMGTNFRLPQSLPGAQITGANFGHGIYFATDWRKSYGYTGRGYYSGGGGGGVQNRGCFMFVTDMIMGHAYRAPSTGSWSSPPQSCVKCHRPNNMQGTYRSYGNRGGATTCQCGGAQVQSDSVFGVGGDNGHGLENDEHIIFSPDYQRIRYVVEFDWLT